MAASGVEKASPPSYRARGHLESKAMLDKGYPMRNTVFLVIWLLLTTYSHAANACPNQALRVGVYELSYIMLRSESGELDGAAIDVLKELGTRTGCRLSFFYGPQARVKSMFLTGQLDIITSTKKDEFDAKGVFVHQFSVQPVIIHLGRDGKSLTLGEIFRTSPRFLAVRGADSVQAIINYSKDKGQEIQVDYSPTPEITVKKILAKRGDFLVGTTVLYYRALLDQIPDLNVGVVKVTIPPLAAGYYINRFSIPQEDLDQLENALSGMRTDGTIDNLSKQYFSSWVTQAADFGVPRASKNLVARGSGSTRSRKKQGVDQQQQ